MGVLLAAERSLVAARHLPGHLRSGPGLGHPRRAVVDLSLRDLAGVGVLVLPPDMDSPAPARRPATALGGIGLVAGVCDSPLGGVAVEPVRHLVVREKEGNRPFLRKARFRARGVRTRHARSRHHQDGGCREQAPQCCLRNDQSLLPTKLAGVTSTIAIACDTILPRPSSTSAVRIPRLPP